MISLVRPVNPHVKNITDEATGQVFLTERWKAWEQGAGAMEKYYQQALKLLLAAEV